ncbi:unnamed protein product [Coregonus sp. 'balchen']|nr:unnamed protein product [Coregonus sp. 'balchen']
METIETISTDEAAMFGQDNGPAVMCIKEESDPHSEVKLVYFCEDQDTISTSEEHLIKDGSWHGSMPNNILTNVFSLAASPLPTAERGSFENKHYNAKCKTGEDGYIRQCRVSYSRPTPKWSGRYLKVPYAKCKEIGLQLNVGTVVKQKLDLHLLTNAVMVEVSEFAKWINRSHKHVICDILEYNFDLGLQNEVRYSFSSWTMSKLNAMLKMHCKRTKPVWLTEVFEIPDPKTLKAGKYSLKWAMIHLHNCVSECPVSADIIKDEPFVDLISPQHVKTESIITETDVTRCADETPILGEARHENGPADICIKKEHELDIMCPQRVKVETSTETDITMCADEMAHRLVMDQSLMVPTVEEALAYLYPLCKEKGLDLDVKSKFGKKVKLDLHLLTRDVMLEVADFASQVCGIYEQIVCDVLEHNFDLDLQSGKTELAEHITGAVRQTLLQSRTGGRKGKRRCAFEKEAFLKKLRQRKNPAEISSNQKVTPASQKCKEETQRKLDLMRKNKDMDMVIARATKGVKFQKVRQAERHCVTKGSISETDLALNAEETKQTVTNLDQSNVMSNAEKVNERYPCCGEIGMDLDVASKPAKTKLEFHLLTNGVIFEIQQSFF